MGNSNSDSSSSVFRSLAMESVSSSLFNEEDEEDEASEEENFQQESKERPRRWLLDSCMMDGNATMSEIKSTNGEETFHKLLESEEIISRILIMHCSDLLDDLLNLRLVSRSFLKLVDRFNFVSFHVFENISVDYMVDEEDIKQKQLTCKRMRVVRKILENINGNKKENLPPFLSNMLSIIDPNVGNTVKRELIFTYNLKERENITKISNPFLEISKYCTEKKEHYFHTRIPSIEIYLEMNHLSIPVHFNMLLISEETSSFEEYLFRYSISVSEGGSEWETKVFPMHKRQFFSSPKNNTPQVQPIVNRSINIQKRKINKGQYKIVFSFSNTFQLQMETTDIQNNSKTIDIVELLSEENKSRQLTTIQNLIREVKISCSSSDMNNICKRVTFQTDFGLS